MQIPFALSDQGCGADAFLSNFGSGVSDLKITVRPGSEFSKHLYIVKITKIDSFEHKSTKM